MRRRFAAGGNCRVCTRRQQADGYKYQPNSHNVTFNRLSLIEESGLAVKADELCVHNR